MFSDMHLFCGVPLLVIGIGGLVGVLVDLDHFISYFAKKWDLRFWHRSALFISCAVLCCIGAYIGGFLCAAILSR